MQQSSVIDQLIATTSEDDHEVPADRRGGCGAGFRALERGITEVVDDGSALRP